MIQSNCRNKYGEMVTCDIDVEYANFAHIDNLLTGTISAKSFIQLNGIVSPVDNPVIGDFRNYSTYHAYVEINFDDAYGDSIGQQYVPVYTTKLISSDQTARWFTVNLMPIEDFINTPPAAGAFTTAPVVMKKND